MGAAGEVRKGAWKSGPEISSRVCLESRIEEDFGSIVFDHAPIAKLVSTQFAFDYAKDTIAKLESGPVSTVIGFEFDEAARLDKASDRREEASHRTGRKFIHHAFSTDRPDAAIGNFVNDDMFAEPDDLANRAGERRRGTEIAIRRGLFMDAACEEHGFRREG